MQNQKPVVIKPEEGTPITGAFGGRGHRILTARHSKKLCMGILHVEPGKSPHRWHAHDRPDSNGQFTVVYPEGFEEAYLVTEGGGVLQWKENGELKELPVKTGDVVYFPADCYEHQLLNNQAGPLTVVYATAPPVV